MSNGDIQKARSLLSEALDPETTDPWVAVDDAYEILDEYCEDIQ
ncbi:hypothetical protein [Halosegnis longus]|nr:hypothetical protein [Halosegnis longus]